MQDKVVWLIMLLIGFYITKDIINLFKGKKVKNSCNGCTGCSLKDNTTCDKNN